MIDLVALEAEVTADSAGLGYKEQGGAWKSDTAVAELLNDRSKGDTIRRSTLSSQEFAAAIDLTEYEALTDARRAYLSLLLLSSDRVDASEPAVFSAVTSIFGAGSATRASLLGRIQRPGSRAEVLWGEGAKVRPGDVGRAFNLTGG